MAKVKGLLQFYGTIDGITLYRLEGQSVARKAKSISKKKYKTSPNYASFRDAGKEMGSAAKMSSAFRQPLKVYTHGIAENRMYSRVNALMRKLILLDGISLRGERTVANGIATAEGKNLVKGFEFNVHQSLAQTLQCGYTLDVATGTIQLTDFTPKKDLKSPVGATHVGMQLLCYDFDFRTKAHALQESDALVVPIDTPTQEVTLGITALHTPQGSRFFMLRILFYQEVNGVNYALKGDDCGVVSVLGVV
ncbi:hypothetical protein [Flavobacterium sp.]|uniref:hypothetical protein n=1 Tax=Flavobacterium sp. TaxID=239 RepID=UPI003F69F27B